LVVPITAPLPPGVYRVNWHVLSVDSHKTQGSFTFEVRP
jgi:copper resistance protein C